MDNDNLTLSSISIGQRVEKSEENPYGWVQNAEIDPNDTCVLFLGGNATLTDQAANGYAKSIEELLKKNNLRGVKIFSPVYNADQEEIDMSRRLFLLKHRLENRTKQTHEGRAAKAQFNYYNSKPNKSGEDKFEPKYIKELFNKAILPRISDAQRGSRLSTQEACKRIRKLNIVSHCHGSYVALQLEEMMQNKLGDLGYAKDEVSKIQEQMLIVAHAPSTPLDISRSTMISFASSDDPHIDQINSFSDYLREGEGPSSLKLSFIDKYNLFIAKEIINRDGNRNSMGNPDHNFAGYNAPSLTGEGQVMDTISQNVVLNGIKNSLKQDDGFIPMQSIREMSGNVEVFDSVKENGNAFLNKMNLVFENNFNNMLEKNKKLTPQEQWQEYQKKSSEDTTTKYMDMRKAELLAKRTLR